MTVATAIPVCSAEDVPFGEGRTVTVGERRIAIFNAPTGWYGLDAACPHRGGPLADGLVSDTCVACPLHERRYDLRTGEDLCGGEPATTYPVEVRDGVVYWLPDRC
jgi:nitrite reductase [NAD(P)H] small subunit